MGFRQGGYMTVWAFEPGRSGNTTQVRLSSSRKNKQSGEYEQDFSGYCTFIGKAHEAAKNLQPHDRIRLLECDVNTNYDKERKVEYVNYKVFDYEPVGGYGSTSGTEKAKEPPKRTAFDEGELDEEDLPF